MKMTKAIREFIEEQVTERAKNDAKLIELCEAADVARKRWDDVLKEVKKEFNAKLAELGEAYGLVYQTYSGEVVHPQIYSFQYVESRYLPEVKAYDEYRALLNNKRDRAIKDIIVSMELGGTKAELMEMIETLKF